jgi:hypothetical protein
MKTQTENVGSIINAVFVAVQDTVLSEVTEIRIKDSINGASTTIWVDLRRLLQSAIMAELEKQQVLRGKKEDSSIWKNGIAANLESIECTTNGKTLTISTQRNESANDSYDTRMLNIMEQFGTND